MIRVIPLYSLSLIHQVAIAKRGRPRYKQQIEGPCISVGRKSVKCLDMTIYRISGSRGRDIDDAQLTEIITDMRREQREVGQTMMWAHVRSLGYQTRIRECIHRRNMTPRRPYSVPSPNSLW